MRVFVTGATGFIGLAVVKELLAAGHRVLGLARSEEGAKALAAAGAEVLRGSLTDHGALREGAVSAEAVIHLAFVHDFSKFVENCEIDRRAIEVLGEAMAGSGKLLLVTAGIPGLAWPGQVVTEDHDVPPDHPFPRVSEQTAFALIPKGVRAAVVRLPQVHDTRRQGLVSYFVALGRERGAMAYVGEGLNRWAAAHVSDVARLYRLALEANESGARYHAVAEDGVTQKDIAVTVGAALKMPVKSISAADAPAYFGTFAMFAGHDVAASSDKTRRALNWHPTGPSLIEDLERIGDLQEGGA